MASFENPVATAVEAPVSTCKIITIDGVEFSMNSCLLPQSTILSKAFVDREGDDSPLQIIPNSETFTKVLEFMENNHSNPMKKIPKPLGDGNTTVHTFFKSNGQTFYSEFVKMEPALLYEVTNASSCLGIEDLTELCAATYASIIKENPDPRRLAELLNIELPSSSEEVRSSHEGVAMGKGAGNA
jgi:hypothetical protein